jgi:hypothetical protein
MSGVNQNPPARKAGRLTELSTSAVWVLIPAWVGLPAATLVWFLTLNTTVFGGALLGVCVWAILWEAVFLRVQENEPGRPRASIEEHRWSRVRAISWSILATGVAGFILVASRLSSGIATFLVPTSDFPVSELVVLGLTIAVLAILTRHTAVSSAVQAGKLSEDIRASVLEVSASIRDLKIAVAELSTQVGRLAAPTQPRAELRTALAYLGGTGRQAGNLVWTVSAENGNLQGISVKVAIDGRAGLPISVRNLTPGESERGTAAAASMLSESGEVTITASYTLPSGEHATTIDTFSYHKEKTWLGGVKTILVNRV